MHIVKHLISATYYIVLMTWVLLVPACLPACLPAKKGQQQLRHVTRRATTASLGTAAEHKMRLHPSCNL
jgi:hypothetical protein